MSDGGNLALIRASVVQQEREVYAALPYAASFHCIVESWRDCEELKSKPKEKSAYIVAYGVEDAVSMSA